MFQNHFVIAAVHVPLQIGFLQVLGYHSYECVLLIALRHGDNLIDYVFYQFTVWTEAYHGTLIAQSLGFGVQFLFHRFGVGGIHIQTIVRYDEQMIP